MIMEDNNETRTTPEYNSDVEPTLFDFVKYLFEGQGKIRLVPLFLYVGFNGAFIGVKIKWNFLRASTQADLM